MTQSGSKSNIVVRNVWQYKFCCPYTLTSKLGTEFSRVTNLDLNFTLNLTVGRIPSMGDLFSQNTNSFFCRVYFSLLTLSACLIYSCQFCDLFCLYVYYLCSKLYLTLRRLMSYIWSTHS